MEYIEKKIYAVLTGLLKNNNDLTRHERKYLTRAKDGIDSGFGFASSINALELSLRALNKKEELTTETKIFFNTLISLYGEPDYRELNEFGKSMRGFPYIGGF